MVAAFFRIILWLTGICETVANYKTDEQFKPELLVVTELGGYPDFSSIYRRAGFKTQQIHTVRKAIRELKKSRPVVIVVEANLLDFNSPSL